jgi:hypothetical protein
MNATVLVGTARHDLGLVKAFASGLPISALRLSRCSHISTGGFKSQV